MEVKRKRLSREEKRNKAVVDLINQMFIIAGHDVTYDDILGVEKQADRVEDMVRETEEDVRSMIDKANERFEDKRNQLQESYDIQLQRLRENNDRELKELEERLTEKVQRALNNPLAN